MQATFTGCDRRLMCQLRWRG